MSVSVCLSVCVFVCPRSYLLSDLRLIFCACYLWSWLGPPQSGGVVICYVFPVLWMTSYLLISWGCSTLPPGWGSEAHSQPGAWRVGIPVAGRQLAVRAAVGVLNIYDIVLAHNVPAYMATRKWRVLNVTAEVAAPGAESAVCNCLVAVCIVSLCSVSVQSHKYNI